MSSRSGLSNENVEGLARNSPPPSVGLYFAERLVDWSGYGAVGAVLLGTGFTASITPAARTVAVSPV
jgi:hypothetical protein